MGARESNAGDEFHLWWAASRALALIKPGTDSRLLVIEGLSRVDDPDDEYEAVDVAEYCGGDSFDSAAALIVSQLKYSTRDPSQPWTAARLCRPRVRRRVDGSAGAARSVIVDLAGTFAQLVASHGRDAVLSKVRLCLVSNQPGDSLLIASVTAAAERARARSAAGQRAAMLRALTNEHATVIRALANAIGKRLRSHEFCDFLTVLDLSQTGTLDRAALARSVRAGASELTPGRGPDSARRLFDLVRREALPESRGEGLRAADVLAELGVADTLDLCPAPPRLPEVREPLPAPGARVVAESALAHLGGVVVAHGQAGAGKTTAMLQLAGHLPEGSVVVLFDCYGGGEYLSSGEERHTPQRFVTQTVNDLAQRCGTPLLVQPPPIEGDLWRLLARTLSQAVDTLDPGAVLVLVVDAADNAVVAASERGDRGFLPGLVGLRLPARVTVVLTARSHRVESLGAASAGRVEVVPFDRGTSAAHLCRHRPAASDADAAEFHARTNGNPRAQFYALEQANKADWDMPTLLEACARTPEALFEDIVNSALQVSGADAGGQRWLALMVALARPVNTATLAAALDVDPSAVDAFAAGLAPGVRVIDGAIQFRDEDFETYVRDRVDPVDVVAAHHRLADMFLAARAGDPDAAAYVADHLFRADRFDELLRLVLDEDSPQGIADGFRREQVQGKRLDLAARAAALTGSAAAAVRIAARGCDTASRSETLSRLVESWLDLVARYADVDLLRAYALRQRHGEWLAPVQMRLAAALARNPERHDAARAALESAQAWLRRWMAGPEYETGHWQLDTEDVAAAAEARYRLDGVDAAATELRRWRPAQFALDAAAALAARVASEIDSNAVRDMVRAHRVPMAAQAQFLACVASPEADPDPGWVNEVLAALLAVDVGEPRAWHVRILDAAVRHGDRQAAAALAQHWTRELPDHQWAFSSGDSNGTTALRCHAAAAALADRDLDVDALVPASLRPREPVNGHADDPRAHARGEWISTVRPLAAVAVLAAGAAAGDAVEQAVVALVEAGLADRIAKAGHRWFTADASYRAWAQLASGAVIDAAAPVELHDQLANAAPTLLRHDAPALWLDLTEVLAGRSAHTDRAADLCLRAAAHIRSNAYPAPERLELLARAAEIAGPVAPAVGRWLFDQAVDAATGINDDAARLLAVHADLATRAMIAPPDRAGVAARLARAAEDVAPPVTEPGVVPYAAIARAIAHLDAVVGLAAASRWDDQDRVRLVSTLPAALVGAVDGGGITAQEALLLDHLIEDDTARLDYQLAVIDRLTGNAAGAAATRIALTRAAEWLRHHVPARSQPTFARRLLDAAAARGLDGHLRGTLGPVCALGHGQSDRAEDRPSLRWGATELPAAAQALLEAPSERGWATLGDDVAVLANAYVYGEEMRSFVAAVACAAPSGERLDALAAVAALTRHGADIVLSVLATCVKQWCDWPGVSEWAASTLPGLLTQHLPDLAWRQDSESLLSDLRAFADDHAIRRAILMALPEARPRLTAHGWQNIAALLGRLCDTANAADALDGLLTDRADDIDRDRVTVSAPSHGPIPSLLWSALGHPRREIR